MNSIDNVAQEMTHVSPQLTSAIAFLFWSVSAFASGYFYLQLGGKPIITLLRIAACLCASYVTVLLHRLKIDSKSKYAFAMLLAVAAVGAFRIGDFENSFYSLRLVLECYLIPIGFLLLVAILIANRIFLDRRIMFHLKVCNLLVVATAIAESLLKRDLFEYIDIQRYFEDVYRVNGTFSSSEELAVFCTAMNCILLSRKRDTFSILLVLANFLAIYNTYFRTAYIINVGILLWIVIGTEKLRRRYLMPLLIGIGTVCVAIFGALSHLDFVQTRLLDTYSLITRLANYDMALENLRGRALFGYGIGNYEQYVTASGMNLKLISNIEVPVTVHNWLIGVLMDNGIVLTVFYVTIMWIGLKPLLAGRRACKLLLSSYACFGLFFNVGLLSTSLTALPILLYTCHSMEQFGTAEEPT